MAEFSENDINEAKKRVREMKNRARGFIEPSYEEKGKAEPIADSESEGRQGGFISELFSSNDSALILALVLVLANEGADNMLILALLYILL